MNGVHLDEALSGYLDGELDPHGRQHAEDHLATCAECRSQLDALNRVRSVLRGASQVEPPPGFIERVVRERRRRRFIPAIAAVAGLAAVWLLVLGVIAAGPLKIEPPVGDIATAQAGLGGRAVPSRAPERVEGDEISFEVSDEEDIPAAYDPPDEVAGTDLVEVFRATNEKGWLAVYEDDGSMIVVYEQLGEYQVGELPSGGEQFEIDGSRAWRSDDVEGRIVVVVQRGWMVYTLAGEVDVDRLVELAGALPERDEPAEDEPSFGDRVNDAIDRFLDGFSLGV
jgi:Putative zinc-finger